MSRSDDFNRADNASSLGTPSDGGSAWTADAGTLGISSNKAYSPSTGTGSLEASAADMDVQVTISTFSDDVGIVARVADQNNYLLMQARTANYLLFKRVSGSFTQLGNAGTPASGDVIILSCSGNSVVCKVNGVSIISVTESAGNTNTRGGLRVQNTTTRLDDFSITTAGATGQPAMRRLGLCKYCRPVEIGREGVMVA